jgi:hypothetical protein
MLLAAKLNKELSKLNDQKIEINKKAYVIYPFKEKSITVGTLINGQLLIKLKPKNCSVGHTTSKIRLSTTANNCW